MPAATAQPLVPGADRRVAAARRGAAKRRLQSPDDRRLATWLAAHTDRFDYERIELGFDGRDGPYYRPPNPVVEAALNGPRHEHLRRLQVDDVRRHRSREHKIRSTPTHSQRRAVGVLRIDADAHAGQVDAADLVAFLDGLFFRPHGRPLYDESSDHGHSGYFTFEMARLPWRAQSREAGDVPDLGPRGDGTYVRRAEWYNALFRRVQRALQRIAAHHGFAATVELNGRFTVTARGDSRPVQIAEDGTVYDAATWEALTPARQPQPPADGERAGEGAASSFEDVFRPMVSGEMPGRVRLVTRGETFRAPRCPGGAAELDRLERSHFLESVLHDIVRYAAALDAAPVAPQTPEAAQTPYRLQPPALTAPAVHPATTKRRPPRRVRRASGDLAAVDAGGSNPFRDRFAAVRRVAIAAGWLGTTAHFATLSDHVQEHLVQDAMSSGVAGTAEQYRSDLTKLFRTHEERGGEQAGSGGLRATEAADFPRVEQIVRSKCSRARLRLITQKRSPRGRRLVRGRVDYDTVGLALVCVVLNASKSGVRRDGGRVKQDHCPTTAVINWMAYFGHSVNGSWVAEVTRLLIEIGEIQCVTRKYVPGKFARRYAVVGAARRLPFVRHLYPLVERRRRVVAPAPAAKRSYVNITLRRNLSGQGPEMDTSPEGMKGLGAASPPSGVWGWGTSWGEWLCRRREAVFVSRRHLQLDR